MKPELIRKIQKHIVELKEFQGDFLKQELLKQSQYMNKQQREEYLSEFYSHYGGIDLGSHIIILNEESRHDETERRFYLYWKSEDAFHEASEEYDELFRNLDDEFNLRDWPSYQDIISKGFDNTIDYGDVFWKGLWLEDDELHPDIEDEELQKIADAVGKETLGEIEEIQTDISYSNDIKKEKVQDIYNLFHDATMSRGIEFKVDEDGDIYVKTGCEI